MTFKEKWMLDNPGKEFKVFGAKEDEWNCPYKNGYEAAPNVDTHCMQPCMDCWNREMPGTEEKPHILDSGERQQFVTGAVRDIQKGKGRCDLMPLRVLAYIWRTIDADSVSKGVDKARVFEYIADYQDTGNVQRLIFAINSFTGYLDWPTAFLEVSKHFEEGAEKYGENNWQKGLPVGCYINSAIRHYIKWLRGDKDEPHDRAFVWNLLCCIWECKFSPRAMSKKEQDTPVMVLEHTTGERSVQVAYLCDRRACTACDNPGCQHTEDVNHAVNFEAVDGMRFVERNRENSDFE